tara:strand:- start:947 stop:1825 length:879 start_codon:yes stop_codon:yes gene_type:complete
MKCKRSKDEKNEVANINFIKNIGIGAFGKVWSCEYNHSMFACKIINEKKMKNDDKQLLKNEILIWKSVFHPNIVTLHDVIFKYPNVYCISDLLDESLYDMHVRMLRIGSNPRIITIIKQMIQICDAMIYLHAKDILHRDLKSANILIKNDLLAISDFGLARFSASEMTAETGSYRWMAPEVIRHENYDKSCDVYSFAMLQYEMMTLCLPFASYSPLEVAFAVARGKRPTLPPMPEDMKELIENSWHNQKYIRPDFQTICNQLNIMKMKKTSFGCLQMATKPMKRISSRDCVF